MLYLIVTFLKVTKILKKSICINCKHYTKKITVAACLKNTTNYGDYIDNYAIDVVACKDCNPNGNCGKFKKLKVI